MLKINVTNVGLCWICMGLYWYTAKLRFFCCQETLSSRMSSQRRINTRNSKKSKAPLPSTSTSSLHAKYKAFEAFEYVILMGFLYHVCTFKSFNIVSIILYIVTLWRLCQSLSINCISARPSSEKLIWKALHKALSHCVTLWLASLTLRHCFSISTLSLTITLI